MLEQILIQHCAPTLAGLKVGNLICYQGDLKDFEDVVRTLREKGLELDILGSCKGSLLYLYRKKWLEEILSMEEHQIFLRNLGHHDLEVGSLLDSFKKKFSGGDFPHEIGLLLGYPLEDVKAFIVNQGACCLCIGYWKVYGDEKKAKDIFARFKGCTDTYLQQYQQGSTLATLAVAF